MSRGADHPPIDLAGMLAAEMARLRHALDQAAAGDASRSEKAVHAARRAIKTIRAALRLLGKPREDPGRLAVDDSLGALAMSLSRTRDLHVAAVTAMDLRRRLKRHERGHGPAGRKALRAGLAGLAGQWTDRAAALERGGGSRRADAPALEVVERMVAALHTELSAADLAARAAKDYAKARTALQAALADGDAATIHAARRRVVRHQLQSRIVRWLTGRGKRRLHGLGTLRERLGEHHDLAITQALAGETPHEAEIGSGIALLVARRQEELTQRCRPLARSLFSAPPDRFERKLRARLARSGGGQVEDRG